MAKEAVRGTKREYVRSESIGGLTIIIYGSYYAYVIN